MVAADPRRDLLAKSRWYEKEGMKLDRREEEAEDEAGRLSAVFLGDEGAVVAVARDEDDEEEAFGDEEEGVEGSGAGEGTPAGERRMRCLTILGLRRV